jgi:hypothetical protein
MGRQWCNTVFCLLNPEDLTVHKIDYRTVDGKPEVLLKCLKKLVGPLAHELSCNKAGGFVVSGQSWVLLPGFSLTLGPKGAIVKLQFYAALCHGEILTWRLEGKVRGSLAAANPTTYWVVTDSVFGQTPRINLNSKDLD